MPTMLEYVTWFDVSKKPDSMQLLQTHKTIILNLNPLLELAKYKNGATPGKYPPCMLFLSSSSQWSSDILNGVAK